MISIIAYTVGVLILASFFVGRAIDNKVEFSFSTSDYLRSKFKESLEVRYEKYVDNLRIDFVDNWTQEKTIVEKVQLLDVNYKPKRYRLVFVPEQKEYTYVLATD